jgi:hypothetical protein
MSDDCELRKLLKKLKITSMKYKKTYVERMETTIILCNELLSEAYNCNDATAVWEIRETIRHMEHLKASMEKSRAVNEKLET